MTRPPPGSGRYPKNQVVLGIDFGAGERLQQVQRPVRRIVPRDLRRNCPIGDQYRRSPICKGRAIDASSDFSSIKKIRALFGPDDEAAENSHSR